LAPPNLQVANLGEGGGGWSTCCKAESVSAIEFKRFPRGERKRVREKEAAIPKVKNVQDENGRSKDAGVLAST